MSQVMDDELSIPPNHVVILSVQPASDTIVEPARRRRRDASSDLDVLLAVKKAQDAFRRGNPLRRQLNSVKGPIETTLNVQIDKVRAQLFCELFSLNDVGKFCLHTS